jgi:GNAT superfamily N-acetyltransferase
VRQSREGGAAPRTGQGQLTLRRVAVVRTYLTLDSLAQLRAAPDAGGRLRFELHHECPVALYRRLYREVGEPWYWHDRLEWSDEQLAAHLARGTVQVWEVLAGDDSAGYFELQQHDDGSVEIVYFGLLPRFIGRGIGGPMLTRAVREAFGLGATRVWLHTCTLDSPRALPSYEARGFRPTRQERLEVTLDGSRVVSERLLAD